MNTTTATLFADLMTPAEQAALLADRMTVELARAEAAQAAADEAFYQAMAATVAADAA